MMRGVLLTSQATVRRATPQRAGWLAGAAGLLLLPWVLLPGVAYGQGTTAYTVAPVSIVPSASARTIAPDVAATPIRMVVVHWKIKHGQESEFLEYWAQRSVVEDRSGLIGEFLSSVEDRARFPWINMQTVSGDYTSFFNIGIWKNSDAFEDQIGKYIDMSRPPLPFEAERRERVFLQPERWRIGGTALSLADRPDVK